ncbi:MAG: AAA family ATPase [Candidatus Aenigmarchaeota archaeon]|nr:AAA family ATPase [Candidatus Aenigmarchaeota archaeon]
MLVEKYRPHKLSDAVGCAAQSRAVQQWLGSWKQGNALVLLGPPGTGKSLLAALAAKAMGYKAIESHASDYRGLADIRALLSAAKQRSLLSSRKLLVIDDFELVDSGKGIVELIKESPAPVILITTEYESIRQIRQHCTILKFTKVRYDIISKFLRRICELEGIPLGASSTDQLAKMCNGDIRAALIDLDVCRMGSTRQLGFREQDESVFTALKILFKTSSIENARIALQMSGKDPEEMLLWLEENVAEEYRDPGAIAASYDYLSKADILVARIRRRQSWSLQKYVAELPAFGIALSKTARNNAFVSYKPPRFYSRNNGNTELARSLHCSTRKLAAYATLLGQAM